MPAYGLFPADQFKTTSGSRGDCGALPQALWYFNNETIAVPRPGAPVAGFERALPAWDDLAAWVGATPFDAVPVLPPLVWLGAPDILTGAQLTGDGRAISVGDRQLALKLAPQLPLNSAWFDPSSATFFHGRPLKLRGNQQGETFVARTIWPQDFSIPDAPVSNALADNPAVFRIWLRSQPQGGAQSPFTVESIWRRPGSSGPRAGQPVIGLMLNGAQGDDDEAHGGHFALMTGRLGEQGGIDQWLVNNFYTLDLESEKGIIAAPVPLDNYLGDLNSGQAWYRPSYMLVATLADPRSAARLQSALGRVYNQFYRHQFAYQHARANCAGISVNTARILGWQVPARGPECWPKAIVALPLVAAKEGSLTKGKATFDYLTEDRTILFPAVAFEEMGTDLLRLASGRAGRTLSDFEKLLAADITEILLVRLPQFPSSRAWGDWPVENTVEYNARVPGNPADQKIIPVPPRPFPDELRDPRSPAEPWLRSDYALAAWGLAIVVFLALILRRLLA
ncbi:MAG: hypothetical protein WBJ68_15385 [Candidatus Dechloromonas phosphoritropha]